MTSAAAPASNSGSWGSLIERFVLVLLVCLGGMTIVAASWARDFSTPRVTLLGTHRGISALVTAGPARVLILDGTNAADLGNAVAQARHPGLDRIDIVLVSGNEAAADMAQRAIRLLQPRMILAIGNDEHLRAAGVEVGRVIDSTTEIELPAGVLLTIDVWPSKGGDEEDVTWAVLISRGGGSLYWVSSGETLQQNGLPKDADVTVIGRSKPMQDASFPSTGVLVAAGESISGPELRSIALQTIGPEVKTARVFAGETTRIELDPSGIRSVEGTTIVGSPVTT